MLTDSVSSRLCISLLDIEGTCHDRTTTEAKINAQENVT
jgi:hypothetical protein